MTENTNFHRGIIKDYLSNFKAAIHKMAGGPWGKGPGDDDSQKDSGPWGKPSNQQSKKPINIDETIDLFQRRIKKTFGQGGGGKGRPELSLSLLSLGMVALAVLWGLTGFYRVQEGELAVVTRFGEMVRISSPGLRYHLPSPVENVIITKVAAVNTISGGLREGRGNDAEAEQTLILTGDENMVHTDYTVLWKIKDVTEFLFTARNPEITIKVAAESVIREVIGQTTAKAALTEGRDTIGTKSQTLLQKLMDQYKMGIQIVSIQLQNVAPPRDVIESFNGLQASLTDADRMSNEAQGYSNDIIPRARGEAEKIKQDAKGFRGTKIAEAEGEASRFGQVYEAYQKNPRIAIKRYYLDAMQQVLSETNKIIIDPKVGNSVLPYLPLREMSKEAKNEAATTAKESGTKQ
ncbi:FtsH protease activity modulator HflK [Candidatus Paracaedibacter symbiosus]|uniref:FtsH protease activity modulator HflK n=1 Tax=Candidatus Paracaedibacter symbiosus TaxID=244582 RepID=UPI00068C26C2|nr:FtsH protease activity modulator HflK [Candidatus Paracaedibacter symbiosus]